MSDSLHDRFRMERLDELPWDTTEPFYLKAECRVCGKVLTVNVRKENLTERLESHVQDCP